MKKEIIDLEELENAIEGLIESNMSGKGDKFIVYEFSRDNNGELALIYAKENVISRKKIVRVYEIKPETIAKLKQYDSSQYKNAAKIMAKSLYEKELNGPVVINSKATKKLLSHIEEEDKSEFVNDKNIFKILVESMDIIDNLIKVSKEKGKNKYAIELEELKDDLKSLDYNRLEKSDDNAPMPYYIFTKKDGTRVTRADFSVLFDIPPEELKNSIYLTENEAELNKILLDKAGTMDTSIYEISLIYMPINEDNEVVSTMTTERNEYVDTCRRFDKNAPYDSEKHIRTVTGSRSGIYVKNIDNSLIMTKETTIDILKRIARRNFEKNQDKSPKK